ncbi:MAG: VanZ family protein [Christensenella sp.]|nr:VanZ family protein [Christensenella sp.]
MNELLLLGYQFLCVAIPALVLFAILRNCNRKRGIQPRHGKILGLLLLAVYMTAVFRVTGAGTIYHLNQYGLKPDITQMNVFPFSDTEYDLTGNLLNIALFLPLGFLLPLLWPAWNKPIGVLLFGVAFSLLIEASQLLNIRFTDIDDVLLNSLGAVLGLLLYLVFAAASKRKQSPVIEKRWKAILFVAVMFCGNFLLFNEFGAAKLLYGF